MPFRPRRMTVERFLFDNLGIVWAKGENADMGVKKGDLITIIILLLMFLFCIPIVLEWNVFNEFLNGYAKGFLIVAIARKTADWIMGDKKNE